MEGGVDSPDVFQRIDSERCVSTHEISQFDGTDDERTVEDEDDDMWYEALTPTKNDHEYFSSMERQMLFRSLLDVDNLQFSLLDLTKQVELMESIIIRRFKKGQVVYSAGDDTREFYMILDLPQASSSVSDSSFRTPKKSGGKNKPLIEINKTISNIHMKDDTDYYYASQTKDFTQKIVTKLGKGNYFGHKFFVSNRTHSRTATVTALADLELAVVYPDEFHKWSHFRNTLILNEKARIQEEVKIAKQQYERERKRLCDEMEKLRLNYRRERKDLAVRLQEIKAEAEKAIHEEYEAELERQNKEALLKMLDEEAAELGEIEEKLISNLEGDDSVRNTDSDTSHETSPEHGNNSVVRRQLSVGSELKTRMYKNLFEDVKADLLATGEIAPSQSEPAVDGEDVEDISSLEVS